MLRELMRFWPKLRRAALLACFGILLAGARAPAEDIPVPTNLSLLKSLAEQALTDILDSLDVQSNEPIYVQAAAHHETNWLVAESLADLLRRRGLRPIILEDGSAGTVVAAQQQEDQTGEDEEDDAPGDEVESGEADGTDGADEGPFDEDNEDDGFGNDEEDDEGDSNDEDEFGEGEDDEDTFGEGDDGDDAEPRAGEESEATSPGGVTRPEPLTPEPEDETAPATPPPAPQRRKVKLDGDVLRFRVLELGVTYPKSKRALLLLGPKSITRLTGAHLRVTHVREPEGAVRGVADSERHSIDRFPGSVRAYVEGADYPFARPEMKPAPWGKLVEPAVVLGIVTGLVYLFYANQS
jgi:hypothetical protein